MDVDLNPGIRDFTVAYKPRKFSIDGDVFDAKAVLSLPELIELQSTAAGIANVGNDFQKMLTVLSDVFGLVLAPASHKLFLDRLYGRTKKSPLDHLQVIEIMQWLVEGYTSRPTQPSESSSPGLDSLADGTSSTGGAPAKASTRSPRTSPRAARSTSSTTSSSSPSRRRNTSK